MRNDKIKNLLSKKIEFKLSILNYEGNKNCHFCNMMGPEKEIKLSIKIFGGYLIKYFISCNKCIEYYATLKQR